MNEQQQTAQTEVTQAEVNAAIVADLPALQRLSREQGAEDLAARLRNLANDWQANGNSRDLGDPTAATWHEAARQLLAVIDGKEPVGW